MASSLAIGRFMRQRKVARPSCVLARPGFSTAAQVTNVSGRGVGIDVAMTKIRALGGSIEIRTEPGKGTAFVLRLPVTLAIVRALIAAVGLERYALPLT